MFTSEVLDILSQSLDALGEGGQLLTEVPPSHRQGHVLTHKIDNLTVIPQLYIGEKSDKLVVTVKSGNVVTGG